MNTAAARVSPLFPSDPTEWEKPLTSLGWELKFGHVPDKQPGPGQVATGEDLGIVMGDFRHEGNTWHTVALAAKTGHHPESLVRWGWSQVLGDDLYDLAEGGVCIANAFPEDPAGGLVYVLFKVRNSGKGLRYVRHPRTVEGFSPGEVIANGTCVTAPGSSDPVGRVFGLYQRFGSRWRPTTLMLGPSQLPTLPPAAAETVRTEHAPVPTPAHAWNGLEGAYLRRLFGTNPDGAHRLIPAAHPGDASDGLSYWRVDPHPTPQIVTKTDPAGNTLVGFVDAPAAAQFGKVTMDDDPDCWATLVELHQSVAVLDTDETETQPRTPETLEWELCETVEDDVSFMFAENLLAKREVTAVVGRPKHGMKSWLGAELAAAVATGSPLGSLSNLLGEPRKVLYLTRETRQGQKKRIKDQIVRLCRSGSTTDVQVALRNVSVSKGAFRSPDGNVTKVQLGDKSVSRVLAPWAVSNDIALVVFDTLLSHVPDTVGQTEYWKWGALLQELVDLAETINGAVVYMTHHPTSDPNRQVGSQAMDGKVSQMLFMRKEHEEVPEVSVKVVSRLFVPKAVPISFRVDPVGQDGGHVRHLTSDDSPLVNGRTGGKHEAMMHVLREELDQCHDINRKVIVETFKCALQSGKSLDGVITGALSTTSGTLRRFVDHAKAEGWIAETGKQRNAKSYKLDTCEHVPALIAGG